MDIYKTKRINIGNNKTSIGDIILNFDIKKTVITYLYDQISSYNDNYKIIDLEEDLIHLKNNKYYVSSNYSGFNYILMFTSINDIDLCLLIDKKTLKYNQDNINYNDLRIISIKLRVKHSSYLNNGTIFDGKILKSGSDTLFLITNCFVLEGKYMMDYELKQRLDIVGEFLNTGFIKDNNMNPFDIKITKLYTYNEINEIVDKINKNNNKYNICGLMFSPQMKGNIYYYLMEKYNNLSTETNIMGNFIIKKEIIPDVYSLYLKDNNTTKRIGIAEIPTAEISHFCKYLCKNPTDEIIMKCQYSQKFHRWIPIEKVNNEADEYNIIIHRMNNVME